MVYTLVPLGNPGEKYARTRHNAARIVLDMIASDVAEVSGIETFIPDTFMNESGKAVAEYLRYHEDRELIIMHDDKDLPCGMLRISFDKGDGGHNGVKSIIESLSKKDFIRIRLGIAPLSVTGEGSVAPHGEALPEYVLGKMREEEVIALRASAKDVLGAIKTIVDDGYQKAMERFN